MNDPVQHQEKLVTYIAKRVGAKKIREETAFLCF
jgi:hypothetical protein